MPWRRLRRISSRCCSQRQAVDLDHVVEHAREDAHDFAVFVPVEARVLGERIAHEAVRLTEPSRHEPYGGSGCSPQGLVARMFSHHQLLFISLTRSISTKPGSAKS